MVYFPQIVQFPCRKTVQQRTVVNEAADGSQVKLADPAGGLVEWELTLEGMTGAEWAALEQLFEGVKGGAGSFAFLDPFGNLLAWSEELSATAWTHSPGLQLSAGISDPLGGTGATRVTGGGWLEQSVAAPGSYQYCVSVYGRSDSAARVRLYERAGSGSASREFALTPAWRRLEFPCRLAQATEAASFRIEVEGTADLFGAQAEAQVGASAYKRTCAGGGVYAEAAFAEDVLEMRSEGPNAYSARVRIRARLD